MDGVAVTFMNTQIPGSTYADIITCACLCARSKAAYYFYTIIYLKVKLYVTRYQLLYCIYIPVKLTLTKY